MAKEPNTYHHIVPQCYLKNFAVKGKSDFVYVYDKVQNKSYTKAIKDIAGIDDFYTISPNLMMEHLIPRLLKPATSQVM